MNDKAQATEGPKDLNEALDLVDQALDDAKAALSDGKVNWLDLPKFIGTITKIGPAIEGAANIWPEAKALVNDPAQMAVVIARVGVTVKKIADIFKPAG
jgi:hypothetical protein